MSNDVEKVKRGLRSKRPPRVDYDGLLSTGSTLLNLECSGHWKGAVPKGSYVFFVGDSSSGKTFFSLTMAAEATYNSIFDDYQIIYDGVEGGALMDIEKFFGKKAKERIKPPYVEDGVAVNSSTAEEFYFNVSEVLKEGPCIYILDSMDALSSEAEQEKFEKKKSAHFEGKQVAGEYSDGKAKVNSKGLRTVLSKIRRTGSILVIINQTRDNVGAGPFAPTKTRSGGRALTFYADLEMWSSVKTAIKKTVKGKERVVGTTVRVHIKKNRFAGRQRSAEIPIYYSYGIDDIGSCIDFLVNEGTWKKSGQTIKVGNTIEGLTDGKKLSIINQIEDNGLENKLRQEVMLVWAEIEEACKEKRKPRY